MVEEEEKKEEEEEEEAGVNASGYLTWDFNAGKYT